MGFKFMVENGDLVVEMEIWRYSAVFGMEINAEFWVLRHFLSFRLLTFGWFLFGTGNFLISWGVLGDDVMGNLSVCYFISFSKIQGNANFLLKLLKFHWKFLEKWRFFLINYKRSYFSLSTMKMSCMVLVLKPTQTFSSLFQPLQLFFKPFWTYTVFDWRNTGNLSKFSSWSFA